MTAPSSAPETTREPSGLLAFAGAQRAAALPGRLAPANWDPAMRRQAIGVRHILDAADRQAARRDASRNCRADFPCCSHGDGVEAVCTFTENGGHGERVTVPKRICTAVLDGNLLSIVGLLAPAACSN